MRAARFIRSPFALAALTLVASCSDVAAPEARLAETLRAKARSTEAPPASEAHIVKLAPDARPLESRTLTFYAVRGKLSQGRLSFLDDKGKPKHEFLRLTIGPKALLTLPDGTPMATGDSVLITITVVDPTRIMFDFAPAGLTFNPAAKPDLRLRYEEAHGDLNSDGVVDAVDDEIEDALAIWRQETPADPFVKIGSALLKGQKEVRVDLDGFSRYAIAY